jgi:hypothetical protein
MVRQKNLVHFYYAGNIEIKVIYFIWKTNELPKKLFLRMVKENVANYFFKLFRSY